MKARFVNEEFKVLKGPSDEEVEQEAERLEEIEEELRSILKRYENEMDKSAYLSFEETIKFISDTARNLWDDLNDE